MGKTLLYIDDDQDDLEIFMEAVQSLHFNYKCLLVAGAVPAFDLLKSLTPDYIFLDINMPGLNGHEVLKILRKDENLRSVPIIILSTSIMADNMEELISNGATTCMVKPNSFTVLCKELSRLLKAYP